MPIITAYNSTAAPVVIDAEGRTLGGREWGPVSTTEDAAKVALEDGRLVAVKAPSKTDKDVNPDAAAAFEATTAATTARKGATEEN